MKILLLDIETAPNLGEVELMKICKTCEVEKPLSEFYEYKGSRSKSGYRRATCKACLSIKSMAYNKTVHPDRHRAHQRKHRLKSKYGITVARFNEMLAEQNGCCAICGKAQERDREMNVDHCHKTGEVRKLLCDKCNMAVGLFNDDPTIISKAMEYLNAHITT